MSSTPDYSLSPIGKVASPFKQKFAIPRQPTLANAKGVIHFEDDYNDINCFRDLQGYTHLWILFVFHENVKQGWQPTVRAPRLGGNKRLGVFASRSTFRPNGIGMSAVKNLGVEQLNGKITLHIGNIDLLDGTPVIDIKPYVPYCDVIADAQAQLIDEHPLPNRTVTFSHSAEAKLKDQSHSDLYALIEQCLSQDPRPAYRQSNENDCKLYKVTLYNCDITWTVKQGDVIVVDVSVKN